MQASFAGGAVCYDTPGGKVGGGRGEAHRLFALTALQFRCVILPRPVSEHERRTWSHLGQRNVGVRRIFSAAYL
eukprot:scaffold243901_cov31-Tisochrysis_lutea.AAC.4